jgi:hypothetical protein
MSRRSKRRHRQQKDRNQGPRLEQPAAPVQSSKGGTKGRAVLIGVAVVAAGAVLYAVSAGSGRKGGDTTASLTNAVAAAAPIPATSVPPLLTATAAVASAVGPSGPKIQFATPTYDFGKVKGGDAVKYVYIFTNVGGTTLQVSNVQASCGCTTAGEWTRQVEPGKTGSIPVQFNSGGFSGQIGKSITVTCNDTNQRVVVLQLKGNVWKPIDVMPQMAVLNVTAESPSTTTTVRIVNNEEAPLTLSGPEVSNAAFAAELKTNQPGKQFELVIRTVPPLPAGNVQGQFTLKTSSTNLPVINVSAWANVQPVVVAVPAQIALPAAPLAGPMPSTVSIRNNGTNTLALSEPAVNAKGVDVQLRETEPGRAFAVALNFPAGFEIAQGEKVELSVKSNHPQFPSIKVPVIQPPRPAPTVVPVGTPAAPPSASQ